MIRQRALFALLLTLSLLMPERGEAGDLLGNGDFRLVDSTGKSPSQWQIPKGDGTTRVELLPSSRAMQFKDLALPNWGNLYQSINLGEKGQLKKGDTIRLSGRYLNGGMQVQKGGRAQISVTLRSVEPGQAQQQLLFAFKPTAEWKTFRQELAITHEIKAALVEVTYVNCTGELQVSDLSLEVVDPYEKLTLFSLFKPTPVPDGQLGDEAWKGAQKAIGFVKEGTVERALAEVQIMSCYDQQRLTFA